MKKLLLFVGLFYCCTLQAEEFLKPQTSITLKKAYWSVARLSSNHLVLLADDVVDLGEIKDSTFQKTQHFAIQNRDPLRIFAYDCNADGQDEIVVSALERGVPASFVLSVAADGKLSSLIPRIPWHLVVLERNNQKILLGQKSRSTQLFAGAVQKLSCDGKIVAHEKIALPRAINLFEFSFVKTEPLQIAETHDLEPLTLWEQDGKHFQKLWQSADRHGSKTAHVVELSDSNVLASTQENFLVPHGPLAFQLKGKSYLAASRSDWAFGGVVGRVPLIKSAQLLFYVEEPEAGFDQSNVSKTIAGSVLDSILDKTAQNGAQLLALIAPKGQPNKRLLLSYELK